MAKNMTQTQNQALLLLRARLDPKHPMFAGSDEIAAALGGASKPYFDTHVLPLLDYLISGREAYYGEAGNIKHDYASRAACAQARQRAIEAGVMKGSPA